MRLAARIVEGRIEVYDVGTGEPVEGVYRATVGWTDGEGMEVSAAWAVVSPVAGETPRPLGRADFLGRDDEEDAPPTPKVPRTL